MGKIINRKKSGLFTLAAVFILSFALFLSGCADKEEEDKPKAVEETTQAEDNKKIEESDEETAEEIPSDLLPKQNSEGNTGTDSQNSEGMEIVGEDGTVYLKEKASSSDKSSEKNTGSAQNSSGGDSGSSQEKTIQIDFSVDSSKADGSVSFAASMTMDAGSTVYDALAASGLSYSGKSYIAEISGLGEKMFGAQSGWKYYVNGSAPGKSCTDYVLKDGDNVQWRYVLKP